MSLPNLSRVQQPLLVILTNGAGAGPLFSIGAMVDKDDLDGHFTESSPLRWEAKKWF
jgi:hypothetical protein